MIHLSVVVSVRPLDTRYASPASEGSHPDTCCCTSLWSAPRLDCAPWGRKMRPEGPRAIIHGRQMGGGFFSAEFKRTTVQRILTGEKTVAELSR